MTRRNMALRAGGRDAILAEVEGLKNPRAALRKRLADLKKQDLMGWLKQYKEATGLKPYDGMKKAGKAVRSPTVLTPAEMRSLILDAEFPKATKPKRYTREELEGFKGTAGRPKLTKIAAAIGVKGKGSNAVIINAILKRYEALDAQRMEAREAGRLKLVSGKGLKRGKRKRGEYDAVRHGKGPFRYVIVKGGRIVVDAGPIPTAREATIAAKTLLRTKAKAFVHPISQADGNRLVDMGTTGLEQYGRVVDGYVVRNLPGNWEAFVYQPKTTAIAYAGGRGFERLIPTGANVEPLSLMNVPDDFYASPKIAANRRKRRTTKKRR